MRIRGAASGLLAVCALVTAVGCGSESVSGSPSTASPESGQPSFDPCTIPDEALREVGVDPATEDPDFLGVEATGWEVCGWAADWYFVTVFATTRSIDEVKSNPRNTGFAPAVVGSRNAFTYHEVGGDPDRGLCDVAFGVGNESVLVRVAKKGSAELRDDPCAVAIRTAVGLDDDLPK
ncbi:DUF3558 domain-containing protein [Rhodococcus sp. NPDC058514]|uniref:DUF3558 domain-containing protein n=1 Tax=unclassified Rhodococcus (in: high G+C Gram-positive bacteria) TaxID=192944 RepID=UPI003667C886